MIKENIRLIPYAGNKLKYLDLILPVLNTFDKQKTFIDAFGGSGSIALNVDFNKVLLNEYETSIYSIYNSFKFGTFEQLQNLIIEFNLKEKSDYYKFRSFVNTLNKTSIEYGFGIFWLVKSCINNLSRFNKKKNFNQAFGGRFSQISEIEFDSLKEKFQNIEISELDFFNLENIKNSVIFLDPPYSKTVVGYGQINSETILKLVKKLSIENDVILTYDIQFKEFQNCIELRKMSNIGPRNKKEKTNSEYLMWNFKKIKNYEK